MKQVFISYPSASHDLAFEIMEYLEKQHIDCFIAPRDIEGGKNYASALMRALNDCSMVLLVAAEAINRSEHVLNELDVIFNQKKPILPVFVENFQLLDEIRYYIGRKQWVTAYPDELSCYLHEIYEAVMDRLPADKRPATMQTESAVTKDTVKTTVFEYHSDRGVMFNPEDHQRNVSFRTDTFVNMMGGIFDSVKALVGEAETEAIFYNSGYTSGRNFAERINSQWDTGFNARDIQLKFDKWCRFDSCVGWGKFSSDVVFDEQNDSIRGTICINEAFIVDNKNKRKICAFIRGYCTGVVEVLLEANDVTLTCRECPMKSRLGTRCVFDFELT